MLTAWVLGSFFFIFVLGAIVYVLALKVEQPEVTSLNRAETVDSSVDGLTTDTGNHLIAKGCQVVFSPRAFVDYPFDVRVVFARPDASKTTIQKAAEMTGHRRSNIHRSLRAGEYHGWPRSALQDPELAVIGRQIEFESKEAEPRIRVELKPPGESFGALKIAEEQVLKQSEETVFSLWLHPLESKKSSLPVVISLVEEPAKCRELAMITLTIPVAIFPIALR
jgi:hypothetical protein